MFVCLVCVCVRLRCLSRLKSKTASSTGTGTPLAVLQDISLTAKGSGSGGSQNTATTIGGLSPVLIKHFVATQSAPAPAPAPAAGSTAFDAKNHPVRMVRTWDNVGRSASIVLSSLPTGTAIKSGGGVGLGLAANGFGGRGSHNGRLTPNIA